MFAASCTEDVPTLALLADKVNPVFQNLFTFGICAQFFRRTRLFYRRVMALLDAAAAADANS